MAASVTTEKLVYLLDPVGASRRPALLRAADACIRAFQGILPVRHEAIELPWAPAFFHKHDGLILSMGQFLQWAGAQIQSTGAVQIWPGTPVAEALIENHKVVGVRLVDQGVDKNGAPSQGFTPGMDVHAALTVLGDGPVGPVGHQIDEQVEHCVPGAPKRSANRAVVANHTSSATAMPASAKAPAAPTSSPARALMKPGRPDPARRKCAGTA